MNANYKTPVPRLFMFVMVFLVSALGGCAKKDEQPTQPAMSETVSAPLVVAPAPAPAPQAQAQQYKLESGAAESTYVPQFQQGQLIGITEQRATAGGLVEARYDFQGARLLRYSGAAFETDRETVDSRLEIEFDLRGAVVLAQRDGQPASQEDVAQVRAHAQLLRSHALAQHASRAHNTATSH